MSVCVFVFAAVCKLHLRAPQGGPLCATTLDCAESLLGSLVGCRLGCWALLAGFARLLPSQYHCSALLANLSSTENFKQRRLFLLNCLIAIVVAAVASISDCCFSHLFHILCYCCCCCSSSLTTPTAWHATHSPQFTWLLHVTV